MSTPAKLFPGAARAFTEAALGGPCNEFEDSVTVQTTATSIVNNSPDRVGLVIINLGANDIYIGLTPAVSTTNGIKLPANGGSVSMNVRDDFILPSRQWWGIANGGTSATYELEETRSIYTPPEEA